MSVRGDATVASGTTPATSAREGWTLHEYHAVDSTNLTAAGLPAWHAVRASVQTAGRGRFQRNWVSDEGGLWLSAVLPVDADPRWRTLPLAAGLAVGQLLRNLWVTAIRLRWPNDVLVHDRKICGLLLDQFQPGLTVVGLGLNVSNSPETTDPALHGRTSRLQDVLLPGIVLPNLTELAWLALRQLRAVWQELSESGFASLLPRINALWEGQRPVELDLDGDLVRGLFIGVDEAGRLILSSPGETRPVRCFEPHEVRHLLET